MWGCSIDRHFVQCAALSYSLFRFGLLIVAAATLTTVLVVVGFQVFTSSFRLGELLLWRLEQAVRPNAHLSSRHQRHQSDSGDYL